MSTLKVNEIQDTSGNVQYTCKAWVNFNGTGTVAILASGNVSSITDSGSGKYRLNFATDMPDANYSVAGIAVCGSTSNVSGGTVTIVGTASSGPSTKTTSAVLVGTGNDNTGGFTDNANISFVIFR